MGILDRLRSRFANRDIGRRSYTTFTEYSPMLASFDGGAYEMALTRAAVERFALACSKLSPEVRGSARPQTARMFTTRPNPSTTWSQFLSRLATVYMCDNTAYVLPGYARDYQTVVSLHIAGSAGTVAEVIEYADEDWIRITTPTGQVLQYPIADVCILTRFQYTSDYFGGDTNALLPTMQLLDRQEKAQKAAMEHGADVRFIGQLVGQVHEDELEKKRKRFVDSNLSPDNASGLLLYDSTFSEIKQVTQQNYAMNTAEAQRIENDVFTYFGTSKEILQNSYTEDQWNAYYEGMIEPFAIQLSEGLTNMLYTPREQQRNSVEFSSNRLQFASASTKLKVTTELPDRGVMTMNEVRDVWQMPRFDDGDKRIIRGEYVDAEMVSDRTAAQLDGNPQEGPGEEDGNAIQAAD